MAGVQEKSSSNVMKKIKVENWSSFLLQKLYHCYTQKKHCDFTLKMVDGNLKVHRVVMNACSNYFLQINLENSNTVTLPPDLKKELMEPIVNFIYSGVLSFKTDIQKDLVKASKILKIDILTKLIDSEDVSDSKVFANKTISFEDAHIKERHFLSSTSPVAKPPLKSALKSTPPPLSVIKSTGSTSTPPVTPSTSGAGKMAMKKLPFWKKRSTIPGTLEPTHSSAPPVIGSQPVTKLEEDQDVKPCRFELPEDSVSGSSYFYVPNFDNPLSYESESIVKPDERILKRVTQAVAESVSERKKMKLIKSVVDQEMEDGVESQDEEILPDDDYEDYEFPPARAATVNTTPKPILKTDKLDSARKKSVRFSTPSEVADPAPGESRVHTTSSDQGSVYNDHTDESNTITTKIVTIKQEVEDESPGPPAPLTRRPSVSQDGSIHVSLNKLNELASIDPNHAKIIEEVLLKYPDLVQGNRNFKLKVVNSDNQIINYIMNNKSKCLVGGSKKKSSAYTARSSLNSSGDSTKVVPVLHTPSANGTILKSSPGGKGGPDHSVAGTTNTAGRFSCKYCGPDLCESGLSDYYTWRQHMTNVHGEKFDVRMCEYCGLKLSKRNLYLYHLRRVHHVRSESMSFPECSFCSYIALTENLLYKHCKNVHNKVIGFVCPTCNTMFKTNTLLSEHLTLTDHGTEKRSHVCPHCRKVFDRSVNLKAHLRTNHSERSVKAEEEVMVTSSGAQRGLKRGDLDAASASTRDSAFPSDENRLVQECSETSRIVKKEAPLVKEERAEVEAYDGYGGGYIEVPVMQSAAYGTLVLPGGVTIIDTNNARMAEASSGNIGMESTLVTSAEGMLEAAPGSMETNEAVLGTNECGQTVLILNGTQQYILEQQPDGRLILPDILANNCVISYAEDGGGGGLDQGGDYEIINVEQAQQEVMMSGQGILVSHGEAARADPNEGAGQTMYGSHAGETILDSQDPHSVPATLVLTSGPYSAPLMPGHAMGSPLIQTVITTAGGHGLNSSVIQSINNASTPTAGNIHQTILPPTNSEPYSTCHLMTSQSGSLVTSHESENDPRVVVSAPMEEQSTESDPLQNPSDISTSDTVYSTDHSHRGTIYSADHSNSGTIYSKNHSLKSTLGTPSTSRAVSNGSSKKPSGLLDGKTTMDIAETGDYQDGYDSEGGMVIDAPSDGEGLGESEVYEEKEDEEEGVEEEKFNVDKSETDKYLDKPSQVVAVEGNVDGKLSALVVTYGKNSRGSKPSMDKPEENEISHTGDESENDSPPENVSSLENGSSTENIVPSENPCTSNKSDEQESLPSKAGDSTLDPVRKQIAENGEGITENAEPITERVEKTRTSSAVQAKIQAIEEDWGDNLEDGEEEEEENDEEAQVGPSRGEI